MSLAMSCPKIERLKEMFLQRAWHVAAMAIIGSAILCSTGESALRLTLSDGSTTQYYYDKSDNNTGFFNAIGGYDVVLETSLTTFPGGATLATFSQSLNILGPTVGGGAPALLPPLVLYAQVVAQNATFDALDTSIATGIQLTTAGDIATLMALAEKSFTSPDVDPLVVSSDSGSAINASIHSGKVLTETIVNSVSVFSGVEAVVLPGLPQVVQLVANGPPAGYTFSQRLTVSDVESGTSGLTATGSSSVGVTPEPSTMLAWTLGMTIFGASGYFRRSKFFRR